MRELTRAILSDMNLMPGQGDLQCTARITKHINIQAYLDGKIAFNLKLSDGDDLYPELEATQRAYQLFPDSVAKPEGIANFNGCQVFVSEGKFYIPLSRKLLREGNAELADGIVRFLTQSHNEANHQQPGKPSICSNDQVIEHFRKSGALDDQTCSFLSGVSKITEKMPPVLQQGDFALANIGLTENGLIIFDWEDYGKVTLPGFDLCVFVCSFLKYDSSFYNGVRHTDDFSTMQDIISRVCARACFTEEEFWQLIPFYLTVFAYLKDTFGYGNIIRDRLLNALPGWVDNAKKV